MQGAVRQRVAMESIEQTAAAVYRVKRVVSVLTGRDAQARLFTLAADDAIPWHYHEQTTDHYFVLDGELLIAAREPDLVERRLSVGGSHTIKPRIPHLIRNGGAVDCHFLLLQNARA